MQQIRGFCNVVIFDGLSNAAVKMGLTQSAVSHQISSLEETLKLKLFNRVGNKMVLTEDGKRFYDHVMPVFKQLEAVYDEFLIENDKAKDNELRIGAYHSAIAWSLPKIIKQLRNIYPDITVSIKNMDKQTAIEELQNNDLDLIFFPIDQVDVNFVVLKNVEINASLLVHKDSVLLSKKNITIEDIKNASPLIIDMHKISPLYQELFYKYDIKSSINFINADWELIRHFVKEGVGCSFFGKIVNSQDQQDGVVNLSIAHLFPSINYKLVANKFYSKSSVRAFNDLIDTVFEDGAIY